MAAKSVGSMSSDRVCDLADYALITSSNIVRYIDADFDRFEIEKQFSEATRRDQN